MTASIVARRYAKALFAKDWLATGKIYIQDPATALAPNMVQVNDNDLVLDMCEHGVRGLLETVSARV